MSRPRFPSDQHRYTLSFPPGMHERIKSAARMNHRTTNSEIVARLQASFESCRTGIAHVETTMKGTDMKPKDGTTLEQLRNMSVESIGSLSPEVLANLMDEAATTFDQAKRTKELLDSALAKKYGERAESIRHEMGKPTGVIRFEDGEFTIVTDLPKKPEWDQEKLASIVEEILRDGADPTHYVKTIFKVSEDGYKNWPPHIQKAFMPARTLKVGRPTYKIERAKSKGGF
ncbi:MAG: Arc family DNA-binding protein [Magnetococcales bacterium]|nr:Arc family DNA-binding protein [Magnetococcales bacterium]